uniref:G_PROTEIN_RECEP_F2_3 domain-containing protein n=1 Tax=Caenorhabditis tropicalis TaxID=1561998 RepID=A0A1I7THY5_9PELO
MRKGEFLGKRKCLKKAKKSRITPFSQLELDPPLPFQFELIVKDCCSAARYCCRNTLIKYNHNEADTSCPATWDGWNCFDSANEGVVPKQCPNYIYGGTSIKIDYDRQASKKCTRNGWELRQMYGQIREHTDYSGCMANGDAEIRIIVGLLTYLASVIFLVPAVFLLSWLRPIRYQPMFLLHRHLLLSCLAYGGLYVVTVAFYIRDDAPLSYQISQNHVSLFWTLKPKINY